MSAVADRGTLVLTFVQLEFPWALGPEDGAYALRAPGNVTPAVVVTFDGASRAAPRGRLARRSEGRRPLDVRVTRVTVVDAHPVEPDAAERWLDDAADAGSATIAAALRHVNAALEAHRIAAADPSIEPVRADQAVALVAGYGEPDSVADGTGAERRSLLHDPPARGLAARARSAPIDEPGRLAALLNGRDEALICEELALRARADLDAERWSCGALMVHVALESARVELDGDPDVRPGDLQRLDEHRAAVGALAETALGDDVDAGAPDALREALGHLEATLRRRLRWRAA